MKTAEETQNSTQTWEQTFTFDRYGNRNFDEANTTTLEKNCGSSPNFEVCAADRKVVNPSINTANNRLNTSEDYSFDAAGNLVVDAEGRQFTYDAENKQVEVENASSQLIGQYYFDGDGKRVKKVVPSGETTIFVYDASGRLIGEYSTDVQPSQDAKTQYLTADHLGTPRINTNTVGNVVSRSDYMPYGEEITSGRSSGQGYVVDDVRQGFTGYENDDETGLEYAQARMYSNGTGRFSGADPYNIILEAKAETDLEKAQSKLVQYLSQTQQWNRYIYVANNPLRFVDPEGRTLELTGTKEEKDEAFNRILDLCGEKCAGKLYIEEKNGRTYVGFFSNRGGLQGSAGSIGYVLEDIINSKTNVELQVTSKATITWADGTQENLSNRGALTRPDSSTRIQIFLSSTMSMQTVADTASFVGVETVDGSKFSMTKSIQIAHELGHAWGAMIDNYSERLSSLRWYQSSSGLVNQNNERSLQVENWQRDRLGLPHRKNH